MATIQLRRRTTGAQIAPLAPTNAGEPLFSVPGWLGYGPNSLWMDTGIAMVPLVDSGRQVELSGTQTIDGVKTIGPTGGIGFTSVANLAFGDGNTGQVLQKGLGTSMQWGTPPPATVETDGVTIAGDGLAASPITLVTSIFTTGLTWTPNTVRVSQATQAIFGGGLIATNAQIAAGTDDATILTPLGLRGQLGANVTTLVTTAKTVVPAINEIYNTIAQLVGVMIYAGTYDGATSTATFNGQGGMTAGTGPLPVADATNHGAYLIVTVNGPGGGVNEPAQPLVLGDWLVSDGVGWRSLPFGQAPLTASNVAVTPAVAGGTNVQTALEGLEAIADTALQAVYFATPDFGGDALAPATQLPIAGVDGGTF